MEGVCKLSANGGFSVVFSSFGQDMNELHSRGWVYSLSKSVLEIVILPYRTPLRRRLAFFVKSLSIVNTLNRDIATLSSSLDLVRSISSPSFT